MARIFTGVRIIFILSLVMVTIGVGQAHAPQSGDRATMVDVKAVGPQVGDTLPNFSLRDQHGETRSLTSLLGPNGAVIVFFRSADW